MEGPSATLPAPPHATTLLPLPPAPRPRPVTLRRPSRPVRLLGVALLIAAAPGCDADTARALGPTPRAARANADVLFGALAARWQNVERHPKFAHARLRLGRHALSPSGIIGDTSAWTSTVGEARVLSARGSLVGDRFTFVPAPNAPLPERPGISRHDIRLRRVGESDYHWITTVDQGIGPVAPADVAALVARFVAAAEGETEGSIRAGYRAALPRSTRALGALFSLDTIRPTRLADGSTLVLAKSRIDADRIRGRFPNFARYIDKYVEPARARIALRDARGEWLVLHVDDGVFTARLRTRGGALVPLTGPVRPLPDAMQVQADFSAKFLVFTVGFSELVGDFSFVRGEDRRGWLMRFRREPKWELPLATRNLVRSALRRPFEGDGASLEIDVRRGPTGQTLLHRSGELTVRESALVRWIGGLGFSAMNEFTEKAEIEENRFNAEVLQAIRADLVALLDRADGQAVP